MSTNVARSALDAAAGRHDGEQCQACGAPYNEGYSLPDDVWAKISPKEPPAGLLCSLCALKRVTALFVDLDQLVNTPETEGFLKGVRLEAAHQVARWGDAHDRSKSAENWFWLVGYLASKALRAAIIGDRNKALHHTISSAAALFNWHRAIRRDTSGAGVGQDADLETLNEGDQHGKPA